jgi:hypothetical protein
MWGFRRMLRRFDAEHYLLTPARGVGRDVELGEAVRT